MADGTFADKVHDILPDIVKKLRKKTPISYKKHMHSCNTEPVISKSVFRYRKVPFYPTNIDNVSFYGKFIDIDIDAQY